MLCISEMDAKNATFWMAYYNFKVNNHLALLEIRDDKPWFKDAYRFLLVPIIHM